MMDKPKLGQRITATDHLYRLHTDKGKNWVRWQDGWVWSKAHPVEGIYVGSRTKQNGRSEYDSDCGYEWIREGSVEVWLIVEKDRQNPVFVLPEDCEWENK